MELLLRKIVFVYWISSSGILAMRGAYHGPRGNQPPDAPHPKGAGVMGREGLDDPFLSRTSPGTLLTNGHRGLMNQQYRITKEDDDEPYCEPKMMETCAPTKEPSSAPSESPTLSHAPTFSAAPSSAPSATPSSTPSATPSSSPSSNPTVSSQPSSTPSTSPTRVPTISPSQSPTKVPSASPSLRPSSAPSDSPSASPSVSAIPSEVPSVAPSLSQMPSISGLPSQSPSVQKPYVTEVNDADDGSVEVVSTCRDGVDDTVVSETATFDYVLNVQEGSDLETVVQELEYELQTTLAQQYLTCADAADDEPFFVERIYSSPLDTVSSEASCQEDEIVESADLCFVVNGMYTAEIRYPARRRRRLSISNDQVFTEFNKTLTDFFNQEITLPSSSVDLKFRGIYNEENESRSSNNAGKIAGSVLGTFFFLLLLLLLLCCWCTRRKSATHKILEDEGHEAEDAIDLMSHAEEPVEERTKALLYEEDSTVAAAALPKFERNSTVDPDPFFVPVDDLPGEETVRRMQGSIEEDLGPGRIFSSSEEPTTSDTVVF